MESYNPTLLDKSKTRMTFYSSHKTLIEVEARKSRKTRNTR